MAQPLSIFLALETNVDVCTSILLRCSVPCQSHLGNARKGGGRSLWTSLTQDTQQHSGIRFLSVIETRLSRLNISILHNLQWLRIDTHVELILPASELAERGMQVE